MKDKIRIGLLLDGYILPYWVYKMFEEINRQGIAEIKLIVINKQPVDVHRSIFKKALEQYKNIFYQLYRLLEKKVSKPTPDAFALKDISGIVDADKAKVMEVTPIQKIHSDYFEEGDIEKIKEENIDVFIRLGFRILRGKILTAAKYGIWSYHHGDNKVNRGGPAGVWEFLQQWKETGSVLQIITEELDGGGILARSWCCTDNLFINRNLNAFYWTATSLLPRTLKRLYEMGSENFFLQVAKENEHPVFYSNPLYKKPRNFEFFKLIIAKSFSILKYSLWRMFHLEQWILLYAFKKGNDFSTSIFRYKKMLPPKNVFWADPCVVFENNKHYIFLEELIYKTNKGHISVMEMQENGEYGKPQIILDKKYHLSYPFVFKDGNDWYMTPESAESNAIELYRCTSFPYKWEFVMNLVENVYACDPTIHFKDGKYWLFAAIRSYEGASASDELYLFYSDTLLSNQWKPHIANPIVSDVKTARPAGRLFMHNNNLYRPSQDCSEKYGRATNINHILTMNEEKYEEVTVNKIEPNWDKKITRTHSLSFSNGLTVIDGFLSRRK
ncbi:MAG: hypothetical protein ABI402_00500 [Ferruginibacter sp.]